MVLTRALLRASHLAQLQNVITGQRDEKRALSDQEREYLKVLTWPWWQWMMNHPDLHPTREGLDRSEAFMDLITDGGYAEANKDRLDALCSHLWEGTELPDDLREYLLGLAIALRHRLIGQSSSFY